MINRALLASLIGVSLLPAALISAADAQTPPRWGACPTTRTTYALSTEDATIPPGTPFRPMAGMSGIPFRQAAGGGCVIVQFSLHDYGTAAELSFRAVVEGVAGEPGPVQINAKAVGPLLFQWVFPYVPAGDHLLTVEWAATGAQSSSRAGNRSVLVQSR